MQTPVNSVFLIKSKAAVLLIVETKLKKHTHSDLNYERHIRWKTQDHTKQT